MATGLLVVLLCSAGAPATAADGEARVLVLNGTDPYLPVNLVTESAMRASLATLAGRRVVYFSETLDAQRFAIDSLEPELVNLLARKYAALRVDVIVTISEPALEFFKRHGKQLWPGARVVHLGFPVEKIEPSALPPGASGVASYFDISGTLDIARRLQPDASRVVVIAGTSEFDQRGESEARSVLNKAGLRVPVEYLIGLPLPELEAKVAAEPPDSIILFLAQFRDRDGRPYTPRDVVRSISATSPAPIYGAVETFVGSGVAAGSMTSYEEIGRILGEQVQRALSGAPSDPAKVLLTAPTRCVADARALRRWTLDGSRLATDCDIRFAEASVWHRYWWQIALALGVIAVQSALIVALMSQSRRRRVAEQAEQAQRTELAHAARLATAGELTGSIAHELNQPLGAILSNADAGELLLDSGADRRDELRAIFAAIRREDLRASDVIQHLRDLLGKHVIERKEFDLREAVTELQAILEAEARRRRSVLEIRTPHDAIPVVGDRVQIQQVLINFVLNALDAVATQPEGRRSVTVSVFRSGDHAILAVRDHGPGIAREHRTKLFESFFTTKNSGMGLGLSIARTIVEAHGGRIRVDSTPGEGAEFQAQLPVAAS